MLDLPVHPLADLFPLIEGEEFEALVADVKANGVREPLAIWRGMLVDGRNRARAAQAAGITPPVKILPDNTDVAGYILSANVHRRQLSPGQRAALAARLVPTLAGKTPGDPAARAGELLKVSERSVHHAAKVLRSGTAGLQEMVEQGTVAVSAASAVASLPTDEQAEVVAAGPSAVRQKAKQARQGRKADKQPTSPPATPQTQQRGTTPSAAVLKVLTPLHAAQRVVSLAGGIGNLLASLDADERNLAVDELSAVRDTINDWITTLKGEMT